MEIIDRNAIDFNIKLNWGKIIGLGTFCVGGLVLALTLILSSLIGSFCFEEDGDENTPFKVAVSNTYQNNFNQDKIPVTEKLTSVQPTRKSIENKTNLVYLDE